MSIIFHVVIATSLVTVTVKMIGSSRKQILFNFFNSLFSGHTYISIITYNNRRSMIFSSQIHFSSHHHHIKPVANLSETCFCIFFYHESIYVIFLPKCFSFHDIPFITLGLFFYYVYWMWFQKKHIISLPTLLKWMKADLLIYPVKKCSFQVNNFFFYCPPPSPSLQQSFKSSCGKYTWTIMLNGGSICTYFFIWLTRYYSNIKIYGMVREEDEGKILKVSIIFFFIKESRCIIRRKGIGWWWWCILDGWW